MRQRSSQGAEEALPPSTVRDSDITPCQATTTTAAGTEPMGRRTRAPRAADADWEPTGAKKGARSKKAAETLNARRCNEPSSKYVFNWLLFRAM